MNIIGFDMKRPTIITGLDIGSSKISAVLAEIDGQGSLTILGQVTQASKGVSRGALLDLKEAVYCVSSVLKKLQDKTSRKPGDIYVNISGETVKGDRARGMIPLSLRGREVNKVDINRCINVASTIHVPFDREIIHKIVHNFSVDDKHWVKNPLGLFASRLSCEVYVITTGINHIQNIYKCVDNAGYDIKEIVFTGMADGAGVLDKDQKDKGVMLLDMGASLTELSIFSEGSLRDLCTIPIGAEDIKGDFKDNAAFNGMLSQIHSKAEDFLKSGGKINSVILTGGFALTDSLAEFLEEKLSYPVKVGVVKDIRGDISSFDSIRLTTAIGLAKYALAKHEKMVREYKNLAQRISNTVVDIFNNYF